MSWKLIAQSEALGGVNIDVTHDMVIGRHQQADVVVQAAHVSRRHAALSLKADGSLWLQDLGSSNGTFVNGQQLQQEVRLKDDDIIALQDLQFRVKQTVVSQTETIVVRATDEGIAPLTERQPAISIDSSGMPQNMGIPKPAPLPADVVINAGPAPTVQPTPPAPSGIDPAVQQQQQSKVGLVSVMVVVALALLAAAVYYFGFNG